MNIQNTIPFSEISKSKMIFTKFPVCQLQTVLLHLAQVPFTFGFKVKSNQCEKFNFR